jgi:hypothetical protein
MAKQLGPKFIKRQCSCNLQFYYMEGKYYVRKKSSLTGKRVKKDKKFRLTMLYAGILAQASKIASSVYRQIPKEERKHPYFRTLTGMAQKLLRKGVSAEEIYEQLYDQTFPPVPVAILSEKEKPVDTSFADKLLSHIFSVSMPENYIERNIVMNLFPP